MIGPSSPREPSPVSWARRAAWLATIWAASVVALGVVAALLKLVMTWAGLTT